MSDDASGVSNPTGKINVAIIGVGNCASSLVQGVTHYQNAQDGDEIPGIMHSVLGGYSISDLNFVAAFDIDSRKVGLDLSEAIFTDPNNTVKFTDVPNLGVPVERGMTHDGLGKYLSQVIPAALCINCSIYTPTAVCKIKVTSYASSM